MCIIATCVYIWVYINSAPLICSYVCQIIRFYDSSGADPGGSLGSQDPLPDIYQRSQKSDVLV